MVMSTTDNLKQAFLGESQANRRYLAFAKKAEEEGRPNVARLFRAVAGAETIHAHNHLRVLGEVRTTRENVQAAIRGENHEHTSMYPRFLQEASRKGEKDASRSFEWAMKVEGVHEEFFREAMRALEAGKDMEKRQLSVCPVCGNTFMGESPEACPICGTPKKRFIEVS
jgi:rubrerythrin